MAEWKPKQLIRYKLVNGILQCLTPLLAESTDGIDDSEDGLSVPLFTCEVVDAMATGLPSSHVFVPLFNFCKQAIHSVNEREREAGLMALTAITEGCRCREYGHSSHFHC